MITGSLLLVALWTWLVYRGARPFSRYLLSIDFQYVLLLWITFAGVIWLAPFMWFLDR